MASLSIPPPPGPASSRLDWGHTGERKSTLRSPNRGRGNASASRSDRGRGGRGGRRGGASTRGGRGHGSNSSPTESSINTTANTDFKPAPSIVSAPPQTNSSKKSSSSSPSHPLLGADSSESKGGPQRAPRHAADNLPSLTIEPASPTAASGPLSASTTSSKMSTRRRRLHNKPSGATKPSEGSKAEAQTVNARKSRSGPSSPHPIKTPPMKTPPRLSASPTVTGSSAAKTNIDSLVEHVRAFAMDHRPSTPGSHIDWAGDEDDSLPDLDDWGVPSSSVAPTNPDPGKTADIEKAQLQLMSPILDDSLKQLPHSFDKTSPSPSVGSGSLSPNIANRVPVLLVNGSDVAAGAGVAKASSSDNLEECSPALPEPSSRMGHASPVPLSNSQPLDSSHPPEQTTAVPSKGTPPHVPVPVIPVPTPELPAPTSSFTSPIQPGRSLANSIHAPHRDAHSPAPTPPEAPGTGSAVDIRAPAPKSSEFEANPAEGAQRSAPPPRNSTHGRSHTVGRPSQFSAGVKRGFFAGSSTPPGKGPHGHGRTQSSPAAHRRQQSRPVLTVDALTRIARTLGTPVPKREVIATNSATSSE